METFETKPKQWGSSLGVIIPKNIVEKQHLTTHKKIVVFVLNQTAMENVRKSFGTLKLKRNTQAILDQGDEETDES